jgi:arylsulfatase A-like enzyme
VPDFRSESRLLENNKTDKTISMRALIVLLGIVALSGTAIVEANPAVPRPNLIVILADDLGYGDLSSYGATDLRTPHIDRLVHEGMRFDYFRANSTVCSPTRASFMTGRYPELVGVPGVIRTHRENSWGYFSPGLLTLPEALKAAGYTTALIGKWHLGLESPNTPNERGFDFFHGFLGDMMDDYYDHRRHGINYMRRNDQPIKPQGHATDLFSDWVCDYLRAQSGGKQPFFLFLSYNAPHTPIQPPDESLRKVLERESGITQPRARLVALVEHMDEGIGRVLGALKEYGLEENTLVIFTSDNGGDLPAGGLNGPLRAGKGTMYEGGLRVVFAARWPGKIQAGSRTAAPGMTMDVFPTLLNAAGQTPPSALDGVTLLPVLLGTSETLQERDLFFIRREGGNAFAGKTIDAVIRGDWKLLQNTPFTPLELYHLRQDPLEKENLATKEKRMFNELSAALRRQVQRGGSVPWHSGGD